jgi:nitrite reductase/ring-hydroxylating ferredoxin subunit
MAEDARWQLLAAVDSIPDGGLGFAYPHGGSTEHGILIRTAAGVAAFRNVCRHLQVRLDRTDPGRFLTSDRRWLVCGEHGAQYRPDDGVCVAGPCVGSALHSLPLRVCDGRVFLDIGALPDPFSNSPVPP